MHHWTLTPPARRWVTYLRYAVLLDILFVAVYGGAGWLASGYLHPVDLYFFQELSIPFVPAFIYIYFSISILFILPLFALDEAALRSLAGRVALAILLSGLVFVLLPTNLGFTRPAYVLGHELIFKIMYAVDPPHNLFPSLHVAYSALIINSLVTHSPPTFRWLFLAWLGFLCVSVILVYQHHVIDIPGGLLVAWLAAKLYPKRGNLNGLAP